MGRQTNTAQHCDDGMIMIIEAAIIIFIIIINTLQRRNVDGLPATCAGSQT